MSEQKAAQAAYGGIEKSAGNAAHAKIICNQRAGSYKYGFPPLYKAFKTAAERSGSHRGGQQKKP